MSASADAPLRLLRTAVRGPGWQGACFVNAATSAPVTFDWFHPQHWVSRGAVIARHTGRGAAIGFECEGRRYLLRHYLRGGLIAALSAERYLWLGEPRTRPLAELKLNLRLHADQLPVPRPVAVRYAQSGLGYTADIITEYLPDTRTLAACLAEGDLGLPTWAAIGRTIRRFHDWGLDHADLNAHNILLRGTDEVFLIDFDKARLRRGRVHTGEQALLQSRHLRSPGLWADANLARLRRSLDGLEDQRTERRFDDTQWQCLVTAWFQPQ
ncbi:MAG TPA: 3-deoxy-D-manno-octulosonic acid kinase [Steroidobacteraceae bacterium]|nr:3-deoxy-D-manno-octulosonic acid kinase [Steroidobacteraceae bacterium]